VFEVDRDIEVIPNFVPRAQAQYVSQGRRDSLIVDGGAVLVHISNFRPVKRISDVVEIFARVRRRRPARLLMVGDGPERSSAERLAEELGVHEDVYFLGMQSEIEEVLNIADLLLLPSQTESFGLVALEAMAAGVPVIASNVGGLPEVVEDGRTGFLLPVGDVEGMAEVALSILDNPDLHREMGQAASRRARENFSAARITALYANLYRRVLQA
jgi:N-acetyl-alpha-D-glucosaminyl L-malate synthase BshA